jgi:hypothetical protein
MTVSINKTQHNSIECGYAEYRLYIVMPSVIRPTDCHYAEYRGATTAGSVTKKKKFCNVETRGLCYKTNYHGNLP